MAPAAAPLDVAAPVAVAVVDVLPVVAAPVV
jgi:hypothetical protein